MVPIQKKNMQVFHISIMRIVILQWLRRGCVEIGGNEWTWKLDMLPVVCIQ